jgi:DDE superfamily endonuclease
LENPRSISSGLAAIAESLGLEISGDTLKRLLRSGGYRWKRLRRSLRKRRNEEDFRQAQSALEKLRLVCADPKNDFDLVYFDQSGFTLTPCVPYAWQKIGETIEIESAHSPRLSVLGFLNLRGPFQSFVFEGAVDSRMTIECLNAFCREMKKPTLLVLDNAPIHHSAEFDQHRKEWEEQGLYLLFLPPYSPELNLIEILWRRIKYEWLPLTAYSSFKDLYDSLTEVLKGVGSKYLITFA